MAIPTIDWAILTDAELEQIRTAANDELARRTNIVQIPQQIDALNREMMVLKGVQEGAEWVPPPAGTGYPKGWKALRNGKMWASTTPTNVWEPGVSAWQEVAPLGTIPSWKQPTGAHDTYPMGSKVTHKGQTWESLVNNNVWEPGVFHGWKLVVLPGTSSTTTPTRK